MELVETKPADSHERLYICPGEARAISRSVHLARLAAFYPTCRQCPLRTDIGHLPSQTLKRLWQNQQSGERKSLFTAEGVRGTYVNELTRKKAGAIAAALASLLWEQSPRAVCGADGGVPHARIRPAVVIGHDERPSSPDIVTGAAAALRRMGCDVIDISLTSKPCFWFAVDHLEAAAGVFVTGAGCEPSWTGIDFCGRGGCPVSARNGIEPADPSESALDLQTIEQRAAQTASRATRHAGTHRTFRASVPYEAGLWKHFHALRPLTVACACANGVVERSLQRVFERLPCRLVAVGIPDRVRNPADPADPDMQRLSAAVGRSQAHLGVLIDDDGQRCGFLDDRGCIVPASRITELLVRHLLSEHPRQAVGIESSAVSILRPVVEAAGARCLDAGATLAEMSQTLRRHQALLGGGESGRYWFRETFPTCDAILTLARVLQVLSQSDRPFSEVAA